MSVVSTPYYKALDLTLILLSCSIAYWLRFDTLALPLYYFLPTVIFVAIATPALSITNFYQETNSDISSKNAFAALSGLVVSAIITIVCLYLTKTGQDYSRIWLVTSVLLSFLALISARLILKRIFRVSTNSRVITLLGGNDCAEFVIENIALKASDQITITKHFNFASDEYPKKVSYLFEVAEFIEEYRKNETTINPISEVWITQDVFSQFDHLDLTSVLDNSSVSLVYIPAIPELLDVVNDQQIRLIAGVPTINSRFSKDEKIKQLLKFVEDQIIAWSALILLSPLLLIISILIKLDSPGPIIFKQSRYGLSGKSFLIWKFRTMISRTTEQKFEQATKNDPRVTRIGKILRKTSIDELPQLLNVITGTMSIVGPRPHPTMLNEQYRSDIYKYMLRHKVKPGITGLAQIRGFRGETEDPKLMKRRIKSDLEYVENWSVLLDVKIIISTAWHLFKTDKAY